jgi:hypothetical protein
MKTTILLFKIFTLSILIVGFSNKQQKTNFPVLKGPYLGQKTPGKIPEIFAPGIISTEKGWEASISFSPDGKELLFTRRATIKGMENRILYSKQIDGIWTKPELPSFAKEVVEFEALFSPNGKKVIFSSDRPRPPGISTKGDVWFVEKIASGWGEVKYMVPEINNGWAMFVSATENGTLYFTGGYNKKYGVFKSQLVNGKYTALEYLPEEINNIGGASHPFIAPDESYILFDGQPDGPAKTDIYISFQKGGEWTPAVKLNKNINATKTEGIVTVSPDGKYIFFHRNSDVYWVSTEVIENLK